MTQTNFVSTPSLEPQAYIPPQLEQHDSFLVVTGVSIPIGQFNDPFSGETL